MIKLSIISIHAPTRGATDSRICVIDCVHFNPRSHKGSDVMNPAYDVLTVISIHAPTRGATQVSTISHRTERFQSTLPQGERQTSPSVPLYIREFQSTLPQGERHKENKEDVTMSEFQSTLPQGERRTMGKRTTTTTMISIHAPTRGATIISDVPPGKPKFQSTLPQGERLKAK